MKRISRSMVMMMMLSLLFITAGEAMAAKVTVENTGDGLTCEYEVALWYKDQNGKESKMPAVYLLHGDSYTFDSGSYAPYMLEGSVCMLNHKPDTTSLARYLVRRWIDKISGDSKWMIVISDPKNSIYKQK